MHAQKNLEKNLRSSAKPFLARKYYYLKPDTIIFKYSDCLESNQVLSFPK